MDEHVHTEQRATPDAPNPGNVVNVTNAAPPGQHTPEYAKWLAEVVYPAIRATWELKPADAAKMLRQAGVDLTAVQVGRLRWRMEKKQTESPKPTPEGAVEPAQSQFAYAEQPERADAADALDGDTPLIVKRRKTDPDAAADHDDADDADADDDADDDEDENENETAAASSEKRPRPGTLTKYVLSLPANMEAHEVVNRAKAAGYSNCTPHTVASIRYRYGVTPAGKKALERRGRVVVQPQPRMRTVQSPTPPAQASPSPRPRDDREGDRDALRLLILQVGMTVAAEVFEEMEHIASSIASR